MREIHELTFNRILGESIELFGGQGTTFVASVRTLFGTPTNIRTKLSPRAYNNKLLNGDVEEFTGAKGDEDDVEQANNIQPRDLRSIEEEEEEEGEGSDVVSSQGNFTCYMLPTLPCFKWWDVYRHSPGISLSCFVRYSRHRPKLLC